MLRFTFIFQTLLSAKLRLFLTLDMKWSAESDVEKPIMIFEQNPKTSFESMERRFWHSKFQLIHIYVAPAVNSWRSESCNIIVTA